MAHQTGITASGDLKDFFAQSKDGSMRVIKVCIENEQLVLAGSATPSQDWAHDYSELLVPMMKDKEPCYLFCRMDSKNSHGNYEWLFVSFFPENSPIRLKMLYASTKATLRLEFGGGLIKEELFGTNFAEVTYEGYLKFKEGEAAPPPLTRAEEELNEIKAHEASFGRTNVDSKHQTLKGVSFPISDMALEKIEGLKTGAVNYVQLSIDVDREEINLESCEDTTVTQLPDRVPQNSPRYHFFLYKHMFEGENQNSMVFVYSMPGYKCSIKERMLYSSCKGGLIDYVEQEIGLSMAKKFEIDEGSELTEDFLFNEVHPPKMENKNKFSKPKGPPNRGARRITKQQ